MRAGFNAEDRRAYRTAALVNGIVFAVALVLCVAVLVLTDADLRGNEMVAVSTAGPDRSAASRITPKFPAPAQSHKQSGRQSTQPAP